MPTSTAVIGNSMRYQRPQAPDGSLRQGSTMMVMPRGEVIWNAEFEKKAIPTLPLSACTPPAFCTSMMRLWLPGNFQVSRPLPLAVMAPSPTPAAVRSPIEPYFQVFRMLVPRFLPA